jgi:hypothetical protein
MGNTNLDQLLEHDMSKFTIRTPYEPAAAPGAEPAAAPVAAPVAEPKRVRLVNTSAANGIVGAIASPLVKDAPAWRAVGWINAK